jgi:curli biogenesis system outer membrane secretion channel CsgG
MKKNLLFLFTVLVVGLLSVSVSPAQAQTQEGDPRSKRYAVLTFDNKVAVDAYPATWWYGFRVKLGGAVSDMLVTQLVKSGYNVIERERIKEVLGEQAFGQSGAVDPETAAKVGKVLGVDYLIMGSVTEWGMKESGVAAAGNRLLGGLGQGVGVKAVEARVKLDFRVVNASTGKIEMADSGDGRDSQVGATFQKNWWEGISVENNEWFGSQIGKATRRAVNDAAGKLSGKSADEMVIQEMLSDNEFIIEINSDKKLKKGDKFYIGQVTKVVRNDSGKILFRRAETLGQAEVTEVQDSGALLKIISRESGKGPIGKGALLSKDKFK